MTWQGVFISKPANGVASRQMATMTPFLCMGNGIVIDTVVCGDSTQHEWRCLHTATSKHVAMV